MASFSLTELANTVQTKWDMDLEQARYAAAVIMPRIISKTGSLLDGNNVINVTIKPKYTVGNVGANGAFVPQTITPTQAAITIDQHKQMAIEVEDKTTEQSFYDPTSDFPKDAGKALAVQYDSDIAALQSGLTQTRFGDDQAGAVFDKTAFNYGLLTLENANIPRNELSFILPPIAYYGGIFQDTNLVNANTTGLPRSVLTTNFRFDLLGVPCYQSTALAHTSPIWKGMLIHKHAFAIAMQLENKYKFAERTAALVLSKVAVFESLYGVKTIRGDHGVVFNIKDS